MHSPHDAARDDQPPLRPRRALHALVGAFAAFGAGYILSDLDGAALAVCVTVAAAAGLSAAAVAALSHLIGYERRRRRAKYAKGYADCAMRLPPDDETTGDLGRYRHLRSV